MSSLTSLESCSEMRPGASTTGREGKAHAELLELDGDVAVAVAADRDGEFAAGQEFGGFATDGGEIGFGQHVHQAHALQRLQLALDIVLDVTGAAAGAACRSGLLSVDAALQTWPTWPPDRSLSAWPTRPNWIGGRYGMGVTADDLAPAMIEAELLGDVAVHLGDAHPQHHLLRRRRCRAC